MKKNKLKIMREIASKIPEQTLGGRSLGQVVTGKAVYRQIKKRLKNFSLAELKIINGQNANHN